jgi:hypothetical protein
LVQSLLGAGDLEESGLLQRDFAVGDAFGFVDHEVDGAVVVLGTLEGVLIDDPALPRILAVPMTRLDSRICPFST